VACSVQDWISEVAFSDVERPEDILYRYSIVGRFYGAMVGHDSLMKLIHSSALPKKNDRDHTKRVSGLAQFQADLPWIKLSGPFWSAQLMELFARERTTLDKKQVAALAKQVTMACDASRMLGLENSLIDCHMHLAQVIDAVINQDANLLRNRLHWVKERDDRQLRDDTAQWLGDVARFVPLEWYQQVIQIWRDELNYKPSYLWIAWRAALYGAPQHALKVAELARMAFIDDSTFEEEYKLITSVLE
jgi:hypothetical protein